MTLTETRIVVTKAHNMTQHHTQYDHGDDIKTIWKNADAVCFDVDSTVIQDEAIDELAKYCGKGEQVLGITKKAMGGKLPFGESLRVRLDIIRPTMSQIRDFIQTRPPALSPRIKDLISKLQAKGTPIYLISGGFRGLIGPVAIDLNIPLENIYANKLKFYLNGDYAGYDETEPTCQTGGKIKVVHQLKEKFGYTNLVMIGDGMTDLETCPPADAFIGYGGNIIREEVRARAKWYVTDFTQLINAL